MLMSTRVNWDRVLLSSNKSWYVYLLECHDGTYYCGTTTDLERRIEEHNQGVGAKYTRGRTPVTLVASRRCLNRSAACRLEAWVKSLPKSKKLTEEWWDCKYKKTQC